MRKILLVLVGIIAIVTNLQAGVIGGMWCYENDTEPKAKLSLEKFVEKHSFKEWVELNRNNQEGFKEEFKDVLVLENQKCILSIMSAILYYATDSKKNKIVPTYRAERYYRKNIGHITGVHYYVFTDNHTILEIVDLMDNNATNLLIELQRDGYDIKLRKKFKRKHLIPMMQGMIRDAKDAPKIEGVN